MTLPLFYIIITLLHIIKQIYYVPINKYTNNLRPVKIANENKHKTIVNLKLKKKPTKNKKRKILYVILEIR